MCVIAIAGKGTDKYSDFFIAALRESARTNNQGFGYAFKKAKTNTVFYEKGFPDINTMLDRIRTHKIKEEDELVVHCRTRSGGNTDSMNSHPFEVNFRSPEKAVPVDNGNRTTLNPVLFHNGTFFRFTDAQSTLSDTYHFCNKFMKIDGIMQLLLTNKEAFLKTFKPALGPNRVAVMSREHNVVTFGEFFEDQGYHFSNRQYQPSTYYRNNSYLANQQDSQLKLHKNEPIDISKRMNDLGINTKDIKVTVENYRDFTLKSTCKSVSGGTIVEKDEYFTIHKFQPTINSVMLEYKSTLGRYAFITMDVFNSVFVKIPKPASKDKYIDYLKLVSTVTATKTSIKKIYNKTLSVFNRKKDIPNKISLKIKDKNMFVNYEAVLLFLNDYKHLCGNSFQLKAMVEACSSPIDNAIMAEVVREPADSCGC